MWYNKKKNKETPRFFETSVNIYDSTRRNIPEELSLRLKTFFFFDTVGDVHHEWVPKG